MVAPGESSMSDENATPPETPALEPAADAAAPPVAIEPEPSPLPETAEHVPVESPAHLAETDEHVPLPISPLAALSQLEPEPVTGAEPVAAADSEGEAKPKKKRARKAKDEPEAEPSAEPVAEAAPAAADGESPKKWYVIKVQSGREESIKVAVERKIRIENLEGYFGRIEIPVEELVEKRKVRVKDKKTGEMVHQEKNVTKKRKKYPGYLFAEVEFNNEILSVFRETSGVGDFVGASITRAPAPMPDHEVQAMLTGVVVKGKAPAGKVKVKLDYEKGDKVKIRDGAFSGMEGEVKHISEAKDASETPKVKVEVTIFGRPVEVELDYWQVDKA